MPVKYSSVTDSHTGCSNTCSPVVRDKHLSEAHLPKHFHHCLHGRLVGDLERGLGEGGRRVNK